MSMEKVCPVIHFDKIIIADSYPFSRFPMALTVAVFFQDRPPLLVLLCSGAAPRQRAQDQVLNPQAVPSAPKPFLRSQLCHHARRDSATRSTTSNDF
jgi:hypothetical protein